MTGAILDEDTRDALAACIVDARAAISRLLFAGQMLRDGALQPDADEHLISPTLALNTMIASIESLLDLEPERPGREDYNDGAPESRVTP